MAWDATRPVPWTRLLREWLLYAGIMAVVFLFVLRDDLSVGPFLGLAASAPLYLVVAGVLAKFGYQRTTLKQLRAETAARAEAKAAAAGTGAGRSGGTTGRTRPAPTRRTSTGPSNRPTRSKQKGRRR